jgi:hypothetical protein
MTSLERGLSSTSSTCLGAQLVFGSFCEEPAPSNVSSNKEGGAFVLTALKLQLATHFSHKLLRNYQSETRSTVAFCGRDIGLRKRLKQFLPLRF